MDNSIPAFPRRNHARSQTLDAYTGTLLSERAPTQDYSSTRGVEVRFTKIPLIATLMAVALSLLIVLPAIAQVSGERTDGRLAVGKWLDVSIVDNVNDTSADTLTTIGTGAARATAATFNARDTYFNRTLYVSNQAGTVDDSANAVGGGGSGANAFHPFTEAGAYNTILITAAVADETTLVNLVNQVPSGQADDTNTDEDETKIACTTSTDRGALGGTGTASAAVATVRNLRNNNSVKAYLIDSGANDTTETGKSIFQGLVAVWDQEAGFDPHNGPCSDHGDPMRYRDATPDDATDNPLFDDGWTDTSAAVILARDGDTLSISVAGVSGSITVVVDGDAPSIDDVSPAIGGVQNKSTVNLGFTVSDDGSGLRYDGESGNSTDADLTPHNGDNDPRFDEPITSDPAGPDGTAGNEDDVDRGTTEDIKIYFADDTDGTTLPYITADNTPTNNPDDGADPATPHRNNPAYSGAFLYFDNADESSQYGTNGWTQRMRGMTYDLDMQLHEKKFDTYYWQVTVKDRVGNMAISDADDDKDGNQPYSFDVDDQDPKVRTARTGVRYDAGKGEVSDRSWIALNFENASSATEFNGADRIDAGTVEPTDFTVKGNSVVSVVVPGEKKVCNPDKDDTDEDESAGNIKALDVDTALKCEFEPRARVYLELAQALDSDETPTIQLLGGVLKDIAGNNNVTQSIEGREVLDRIPPGVTVTVTSDSGATGRAATDKDGSFTVRVESDEDLIKFPRLYFATIEGTDPDNTAKVGAATKLKIASVDTPEGIALSEKETNIWEKKVDVDTLPGGTADRLMAVIVTATDDASNAGNSAGWTPGATEYPAAGNSLKFKDLDSGGFLVEVDSTMVAATVEVLPPTDPTATKKDKTESMNPYIQITFKEGNEYGIAVTDGANSGNAKKADIGSGKSANTDSHADVNISSLTLNGEDKLDELVRVKAGEYVLAVTGLEVGDYELAYTAKDDVGNKTDPETVKFEFEVQKRQPYTVSLDPGWNLVSVPGDPFNPAVGEVIGASLKADTVLAYQGGEWLTAVKNDEGRWQGTLTDIQGGYGYWVRTTALESISTVIPPILPTDNLPTVPVISGWNLLGVVDAEQRKAGTTEDADEYLVSLPQWRVAYSFETRLNTWDKLLPGTNDTVANGKGYWVWSSSPGTLVP